MVNKLSLSPGLVRCRCQTWTSVWMWRAPANTAAVTTCSAASAVRASADIDCRRTATPAQVRRVYSSVHRRGTARRPVCRFKSCQLLHNCATCHGHRRPSVCSAILEQSARQRHVSQFVVGFPAATETHTVPAVIPGHYHVTFLNCNTHSGPSSGIAT